MSKSLTGGKDRGKCSRQKEQYILKGKTYGKPWLDRGPWRDGCEWGVIGAAGKRADVTVGVDTWVAERAHDFFDFTFYLDRSL